MKRRCIVCKKPINDGIIINSKAICKCCEEKLINSYVQTDFYEYYKECIKKSVIEPLLKESILDLQENS